MEYKTSNKVEKLSLTTSNAENEEEEEEEEPKHKLLKTNSGIEIIISLHFLSEFDRLKNFLPSDENEFQKVLREWMDHAHKIVDEKFEQKEMDKLRNSVHQDVEQEINKKKLEICFSTCYEKLIENFKQWKTGTKTSAFPDPTILEKLQGPSNEISKEYHIDHSNTVKLFKSAFLYDRSGFSDSTHKTFMVDIARGLKTNKSAKEALSLLHFVVKLDPNFFFAWVSLEEITSRDGTHEDDYFNILSRTLKVAEQQSHPDIFKKYESKLKERFQIPGNKEQASVIAYYSHRHRIQKDHPQAYISCIPEYGQVRVSFEGKPEPMPEDEVVTIHNFPINIKYVAEDVSRLCCRSSSPDICGGNRIGAKTGRFHNQQEHTHNGTLGCLFTNGASQNCLVSNEHVLTKSVTYPPFIPDAKVIHCFDEGGWSEIGVVLDDYRLDFFDVAVAALNEDEARISTTLLKVDGIMSLETIKPLLSTGSSEIMRARTVVCSKSGYVTGTTRGCIFKFYHPNLVLYSKEPNSAPFAIEGDSGSLVFVEHDEKTYLVGIIHLGGGIHKSNDKNEPDPFLHGNKPVYFVQPFTEWDSVLQEYIQNEIKSLGGYLRINEIYPK
jgi:hypothetical protein